MNFRRLALPAVFAVTAIALLASGCGTTTNQAAELTGAPASARPAAAPPETGNFAPGRQKLSLDVDGTARTATIVVPKDLSRPAPLVFMFHGHGGSGDAVDLKLDIDGLWPEAIVVYPDGLPGHKGKTDPEGVRPGWQTVAGEDGDRDIRFYDAMLQDITSNLPVDADRIYLMGHSNGSQFASLLLNVRGDRIAATANLSAQPNRFIATDPVRSMFLMMGENDPIVPIENQRVAIPLAEQKLGADPARAEVDGFLRTEPGTGNLELATYVHPAGHEVPPEVPALVVAFFQRHTLSGG